MNQNAHLRVRLAELETAHAQELAVLHEKLAEVMAERNAAEAVAPRLRAALLKADADAITRAEMHAQTLARCRAKFAVQQDVFEGVIAQLRDKLAVARDLVGSERELAAALHDERGRRQTAVAKAERTQWYHDLAHQALRHGLAECERLRGTDPASRVEESRLRTTVERQRVLLQRILDTLRDAPPVGMSFGDMTKLFGTVRKELERP